jgi:hypothetical protein
MEEQMGLMYMPLPIYITLSLVIIVGLIVAIIRGYNRERKGFLVCYLTAIIMISFALVGKIIEEIIPQFGIYSNILIFGTGSTFITLILELIYLSMTNPNKTELSKRLLLIGTLLIIVSVLPILILLLVGF